MGKVPGTTTTQYWPGGTQSDAIVSMQLPVFTCSVAPKSANPQSRGTSAANAGNSAESRSVILARPSPSSTG